MAKRLFQLIASLVSLWLISALMSIGSGEAWMQEVVDYLMLISLTLAIFVGLPVAIYRYNQRQTERIVGRNE